MTDQRTVRCEAAALLGDLHAPHDWQPRPGTPLAHCPGGDGQAAPTKSASARARGLQAAGGAAEGRDGGRTALREQIAAALTAAAHRCDGTCGLTERGCCDAHPITWSAMAGGTTHIDGSVTAIAAVVLDAFQQHLDIGEEQAWCKTCRRVWDRWHQCDADAAALARIRALADRIGSGTAPWTRDEEGVARRIREAANIQQAAEDDDPETLRAKLERIRAEVVMLCECCGDNRERMARIGQELGLNVDGVL